MPFRLVVHPVIAPIRGGLRAREQRRARALHYQNSMHKETKSKSKKQAKAFSFFTFGLRIRSRPKLQIFALAHEGRTRVCGFGLPFVSVFSMVPHE